MRISACPAYPVSKRKNLLDAAHRYVPWARYTHLTSRPDRSTQGIDEPTSVKYTMQKPQTDKLDYYRWNEWKKKKIPTTSPSPSHHQRCRILLNFFIIISWVCCVWAVARELPCFTFYIILNHCSSSHTITQSHNHRCIRGSESTAGNWNGNKPVKWSSIWNKIQVGGHVVVEPFKNAVFLSLCPAFRISILFV